MTVKEYLNQKFMYGSELLPLGLIIADLQERAPNQACIDRYLQGLFASQTPIV